MREEDGMATNKPPKGRTKAAAKRTARKREPVHTPEETAVRSEANPQRLRLEAMLSKAIEQVDEEGLLFLLRQANVLIHNQKVDEVNRELAELSRKPGRAAAGGNARGGVSDAVVAVDDSGDRSAVFLTLGTVRKALSREELQRLVRICYAAESKSDALRQLYTIMVRERSDILKDAGIRSAASPLVEGLFYALRRRYRLEDR
jgi:hypothetical protein